MAGVQFTGGSGRGGNQAWNQIEKVQQNQRSNTYADIAAQNADQNDIKFRQSQAVDATLGQGLAETQTGQNASMVRTLAKTPGGGGAAMQLQQADQNQTDDWERRAMTAAAAGDEPTYQYFKEKSGLRIPPEFDSDVKARATYARASLVSERIYRNDPQKAFRYVAEFMKDGNMPRALAATGAPADKPNFSVTQLEMEGKRVVGLIDTIRGSVTVPRDAKGAPYASGIGTGAGRGGSENALLNSLMAAGLNPGEAFQAINTLKRGADPERTYIETYRTLLPKLVSSLGEQDGSAAALKAAEQAREIARSAALYQIGKTPGAAPTPAPAPQLSPPGPTATPSAGLAAPPELMGYPDGSVIQDDATGQQYIKRGNTLVPAGQ